MKRTEMFKLFAAISIYYPSEKWAADPTDEMIDGWLEPLAKYPAETVYAALKRHVVNSAYPPKVRDLLTEISLLLPPESKPHMRTVEEAFALVLMAVKNSAYHAKEEFEKLPPDIRRRIGSYQVLYDLAVSEDETTMSVFRSTFMKNYGLDIAATEREYLMPDSAKAFLPKTDEPIKELVERNTVDPAEPIPAAKPNDSEFDTDAQRRAQKIFDLVRRMKEGTVKPIEPDHA